MKKVILSALFLSVFVTASAVNSTTKDVLDIKDPHEDACIKAGGFDDDFSDLTFDEFEAIYNYYLNQ